MRRPHYVLSLVLGTLAAALQMTNGGPTKAGPAGHACSTPALVERSATAPLNSTPLVLAATYSPEYAMPPGVAKRSLDAQPAAAAVMLADIDVPAEETYADVTDDLSNDVNRDLEARLACPGYEPATEECDVASPEAAAETVASDEEVAQETADDEYVTEDYSYDEEYGYADEYAVEETAADQVAAEVAGEETTADDATSEDEYVAEEEYSYDDEYGYDGDYSYDESYEESADEVMADDTDYATEDVATEDYVADEYVADDVVVTDEECVEQHAADLPQDMNPLLVADEMNEPTLFEEYEEEVYDEGDAEALSDDAADAELKDETAEESYEGGYVYEYDFYGPVADEQVADEAVEDEVVEEVLDEEVLDEEVLDEEVLDEEVLDDAEPTLDDATDESDEHCTRGGVCHEPYFGNETDDQAYDASEIVDEYTYGYEGTESEEPAVASELDEVLGEMEDVTVEDETLDDTTDSALELEEMLNDPAHSRGQSEALRINKENDGLDHTAVERHDDYDVFSQYDLPADAVAADVELDECQQWAMAAVIAPRVAKVVELQETVPALSSGCGWLIERTAVLFAGWGDELAGRWPNDEESLVADETEVDAALVDEVVADEVETTGGEDAASDEEAIDEGGYDENSYDYEEDFYGDQSYDEGDEQTSDETLYDDESYDESYDSGDSYDTDDSTGDADATVEEQAVEEETVEDESEESDWNEYEHPDFDYSEEYYSL